MAVLLVSRYTVGLLYVYLCVAYLENKSFIFPYFIQSHKYSLLLRNVIHNAFGYFVLTVITHPMKRFCKQIKTSTFWSIRYFEIVTSFLSKPCIMSTRLMLFFPNANVDYLWLQEKPLLGFTTLIVG